jgi:tetratricopeptide (TPR) repeat protein
METIRSRVGPIALLAFGILLFRPTPFQRAVAESVANAREAGAWGSADSTLGYLEDAIRHEPDLGTLYPDLIQAALVSSDPSQARKYILQYQSGNPDDPRIQCWMIALHAKQGELDQVLDIWNEEGTECELDDTLVELLVEDLLAKEDLGQLNQVIARLSQRRPSDAEIQFLRGLLLAISSPQSSTGTLRLANELSPQGIPLALELVRTIEDARIIDNQAYTLAQVGQVLAKYSEWNFAARAFQAAIVFEPSYADAYIFLGLSLDELGKDGLESYQQAIELNPDGALGYLYLGVYWLRNGSPDMAIENFERASDLEPENPMIAVQMGHAFEIKGEIETALNAYRAATELEPQDGTLWLILAQVSLHHEFNIAGIGGRSQS